MPDESIEKIEALMCHQLWQHASKAINLPIAALAVDINNDKSLVETDDFILLKAGVLVHDDSLVALLEKYIKNGIDSFKKLDGLFVIAIWNKQKKKL